GDLIAHVAERLPRAAALRRVLRDAPFDLGHPLWDEAPTLDLEAHIRLRRLRAPGTAAQLWRLVGTLHAEPLPRDRPLWQFTVIEGLSSGEVALYTKIHHALLDGQGAFALGQALLDVQPTKLARRRAGTGKASAPAVRSGALAAASLRASVQQFAKLVRAVP